MNRSRPLSTAEKEALVRRLEAGERIAALAADAGVLRKSLYEWRAAYRAMGAAGLNRKRGPKPGGRAAVDPASADAYPRPRRSDSHHRCGGRFLHYRQLRALDQRQQIPARWHVRGPGDRRDHQRGDAMTTSKFRFEVGDPVVDIRDAAKRRSPEFWLSFLTLLLETGLRHEEALGLTCPQVDMQRGVINLEWFREKTNRGRIGPPSNTALRTPASVRRYDCSP